MDIDTLVNMDIDTLVNMDIDTLVNISREYIDNLVKRSPDYFYKNPFDELEPYSFAILLHKMHMILYLSVDSEKKSSKYNLYNELFIKNLSNRIIEELYIRCLKNKKDYLEDYIDYLSEMLKVFIKLDNDILKNIFVELSKECYLFNKISDILLENANKKRSPIRTIQEIFEEDDDIEMIKYHIYEKEIKFEDITSIINFDMKDIKLVFDFLNITNLYELKHNGEKCLKDRCQKYIPKLLAVIKYYNSKKNVSIEFLNVTKDFEYAQILAKTYAKEEYGNEIVTKVDQQLVEIETRLQYTIGNGYNTNVYAIVELPREE